MLRLLLCSASLRPAAPAALLLRRGLAANAGAKKKAAGGAAKPQKKMASKSPAGGAGTSKKGAESGGQNAFFTRLVRAAIERDKARLKLPPRTQTMTPEQRVKERTIAHRFQVETSKRRNKMDWALAAARTLQEFAIKALPEDARALAKSTTESQRVAQTLSMPALPRPQWVRMVLK